MGNNKTIGTKIKNVRESKQLFIGGVAERSGLGIEQIERVEGNLDFPSLAPLIKITRVLGAYLDTSLNDRTELGLVACRKKNSEADSIGSTNSATQGHKYMDYHSLSQDKSGRHMEPSLIKITPSEEGEDFILSTHGREEFICVLNGVVEISYGKNIYILEEDNSVYHDSIVAYHVHAVVDNKARILGIVYIPYQIRRFMELHDRTLGQQPEYWAETTPDKEHIVYSDRDLRFAWSEFNRRVDDMAKGMLAIGIAHGTHIGARATDIPGWLTFLYVEAKVGATSVTVNTSYKQSKLEYLVENTDIHAMHVASGVSDGGYVDMVYTVLSELKTFQRGYSKSKHLSRLKNVMYIGQKRYRGIYSTPGMLLLGQNIEDETLGAAKARVNYHDVVNIQYTFGTTGFPEGVMLTHYSIANNGFLTSEYVKFIVDDKPCCCAPLLHCFGVVLTSMSMLTYGCTQVMVEKFGSLLVLASIHKECCTVVYGVPTMFIVELNHPVLEMLDLTSLRTGITAGSLCPAEPMKTVDEKMHIRVTNVYGSIGASPGMTHSRIGDPAEVCYNTVGHEFESTEIRVVDPETGEEYPVSVQGEMCNHGYDSMRGCYKDEVTINEVIDEDGFLHSGDLGVKDENGNYRITGRIKDTIIRGGENIYPHELEKFPYHFPGMKDVQIAAVPSKRYGEEASVFIILHDGVTATEEEVKDFCHGKITRHKILKRIFFVGTFPMIGGGKI